MLKKNLRKHDRLGDIQGFDRCITYGAPCSARIGAQVFLTCLADLIDISDFSTQTSNLFLMYLWP